MRLLTYREYGCIVIAILCVTIGVQLTTGCATHGTQEYGVEAFTLVVADRGAVQAAYETYQFHHRQQVSGFYDCYKREMWVERGYGGRPDFATLGHEIWHLEELGGNWHE